MQSQICGLPRSATTARNQITLAKARYVLEITPHEGVFLPHELYDRTKLLPPKRTPVSKEVKKKRRVEDAVAYQGPHLFPKIRDSNLWVPHEIESAAYQLLAIDVVLQSVRQFQLHEGAGS